MSYKIPVEGEMLESRMIELIKNHLEKYFKVLTTINKYDILIKRN